MPSYSIADHFCNLLCFIAMHSMANTGVCMEDTVTDLFMHDLSIAVWGHTVLSSPEDICGDFDFGEERTQVLACDVDHRLAHDGGGLLIVMDPHELVEELFPEWLKMLESGDGEEELPSFGQCEADDAFDVARVADTGRGAEEEVSRG